MMNFRILLLSVSFALIAISCKTSTQKTKVESSLKDLTQYVDPTIGTGDHGHVFMGANVPYGAVQVGPTQFSEGWDWCSGYHASDSTIIGFAQTHLSGTGIGDLGDISLMPAVGDVELSRGDLKKYGSGVYSKFSHKSEVTKAGFYQVHLDRFNIDVALTATKRVGFHKYVFPASDSAKIIFDLQHGIGWDALVEGHLTQENDSVISGYRYSAGWAKDQKIYFTAKFSKKISKFTTDNIYGVAQFETKKGEVVYVKIAISPVSIENATLNMNAELPACNFEQTVLEANHAWNEALNKIVIETSDKSVMRTFYTALYHSMIAPSLFCDVNGDYRGSDGKIYRAANFVNYTTFSLWDTYRAAQPLMTLISPEMIPDIAQTFLHINKEQGRLPVWHLMGNETDCMVGNPGAIVLADIVMKNFHVDNQEAYDALKNTQMQDERGLDWMKKLGYLPCNKVNESVAKGLEYGIADWSVAQVAKKIGNDEDYNYFTQRSKVYKYYFDPSTQFMRGKDEKGKFRVPFNPIVSTHRDDDYTEGNAWQYTWLVPHDVRGLVNLFGSEHAFIQKLDSLFIVKGDLGAEASPDISGLIGQYAHGNEPSHQILYLYPFVGQPWKTAEKVREVLQTLYSDQPAGLSGNEDVGQMSAWYVLSSLGIYQVAPAGGVFVFGSPIVDKATVKVGNKTLQIVVKNNSETNKYIQSIMLNGEPYSKSYIAYSNLVAGGILEFTMGATPSKTFGVAMDDRPTDQ